jgi:hypothetical protein
MCAAVRGSDNNETDMGEGLGIVTKLPVGFPLPAAPA